MTSLDTERLTMEIHDLLFRLGASANYSGFFYTTYAVLLAIEQPKRLTLVTKWLYPGVADYYRTNWRAVERSIRTLIAAGWPCSRDLLEDLAQHELTRRPPPAKFIAILASRVSEGPVR